MLEQFIADWRSQAIRDGQASTAGLDETEAQLRAGFEDLRRAGLEEDEAFLVALKRVDEPPGAFRAHLERCRGQGGGEAVADRGGPGWKAEAMAAFGLAVAAAACLRAPELFGLHIAGDDSAASFYLRHVAFFVLPFLAAFFAWKQSLAPAQWLRLAMPFALGLVAVNAYPFVPGGDTEALSALHLFVALWLAVAYAWAGGRWRDHERRLGFVRFSGEWGAYYALIAQGGVLLVGSTQFIFHSIGLDAEDTLVTWVIPSGAAGAVIIAAWLADARLGVMGSIMSALTMLFAPMFALALLAFLATALLTGKPIDVEREVLIGFDLLLLLVLALFLYSVSTRDRDRAPGPFDALQLLLLACALLVDLLALSAVLSRISAFGPTPNRVAALGLNLVLVVNLAGAAVLHTRFLARRAGFASVVRWQTAYLPVYAAWAWTVALVFPPLFRFT